MHTFVRLNLNFPRRMDGRVWSGLSKKGSWFLHTFSAFIVICLFKSHDHEGGVLGVSETSSAFLHCPVASRSRASTWSYSNFISM